MSDLTFSVHGISESPTKFVAKARNFNLVIDEPSALGGTDEGANPIEFLLSSYAGCLNVMGHIVAEELGFHIEQLEIKVSGRLNPERFSGVSYQDRAGIKDIKVELKPTTHASVKQLKEWVEIIENRCPVNDNLRNVTPTEITVEYPLPTEKLN